MKEYGEKIPGDKKAPIEAALTKLKEAHKSQDVKAIDSAVTEMNTAWAAASEDMYKATQGDTQPGNGGGTTGNGQGTKQQAEGAADTVTDAEFEEVK